MTLLDMLLIIAGIGLLSCLIFFRKWKQTPEKQVRLSPEQIGELMAKDPKTLTLAESIQRKIITENEKRRD